MDESSRAPAPLGRSEDRVAPAVPVALRRDDLAAMRDGYAREIRSRRQWFGLGVGLGGLALGVVGISLVDPLGWPAALKPAFFALGWTVMLAAYGVNWWHERQIRARWQLFCPSCDHPMLETNVGKGVLSRSDLAIATGICQHCGEEVLAK